MWLVTICSTETRSSQTTSPQRKWWVAQFIPDVRFIIYLQLWRPGERKNICVCTLTMSFNLLLAFCCYMAGGYATSTVSLHQRWFSARLFVFTAAKQRPRRFRLYIWTLCNNCALLNKYNFCNHVSCVDGGNGRVSQTLFTVRRINVENNCKIWHLFRVFPQRLKCFKYFITIWHFSVYLWSSLNSALLEAGDTCNCYKLILVLLPALTLCYNWSDDPLSVSCFTLT